MNYIELNIPIDDKVNADEYSEILVALLSDYPFDSFMTEGNVLKAYIPEDKLVDCKNDVDELLRENSVVGATYIEIEQKDWNAAWEAEFKSVDVGGMCRIRAPFAPAPDNGLDVIIMPKMSFGTGHHATTYLMVSEILKLDLMDKIGADVGCGTGVLAIVAVKCGAKHIDAVDIDNWAYDNCSENILANEVGSQIKPILGDVNALIDKKYDFVLANINRNILINEMAKYSTILKSGGDLLMSGILERDIPYVVDTACANDIKFMNSNLKDGWAVLHCVKI